MFKCDFFVDGMKKAKKIIIPPVYQNSSVVLVIKSDGSLSVDDWSGYNWVKQDKKIRIPYRLIVFAQQLSVHRHEAKRLEAEVKTNLQEIIK